MISKKRFIGNYRAQKKANETQNHTAGAAAPVKEFKYGGCTGEAFGACKIEDLLKKEENKK